MGKIRLPKIRLNLDGLRDKALDAVRRSEAIGGPGEAKFDRAVEEVVQWLDDQLRFGSGPVGVVAEALTDAALRLIAGPGVEWAWAQLFGKDKA